MPRATQSSPMAVTYARSLLELADERGQLDPMNQELRALREVLEGNPSLQAFLRDPSVSATERGQLLDRVFKSTASPLLMNFLQVANSHGRLDILQAVADAYDRLLDERLGKIEVDVTVAHRLSSDELEQVRRQVSNALKKDAVIYQYVDESIIGGLILRVRDQLIDASVRSQLREMKRRMREAD